MKIVFLSHTADGGYFKVGSHHLSREFSIMGHQVVHLSTNYSTFHRLPGIAKRHAPSNTNQIRLDTNGVIGIVPQTIFPIQISSGKRVVERLLKEIGFQNPDIVFIDQPFFSKVLSIFGTDTKIIYRPTDEYPSGLASVRQHQLIRKVDAVIATSAPVLVSLNLSKSESTPSMVIENGAETERFQIDQETNRKDFVYVGAMDERFDWPSVLKIASLLENEEIHLYGPKSNSQPVLPNNVVFCGPVPYPELPKVLSKYRVGILPLSNSKLNEGRSPMKYYEYLASGLHVLARNTAELKRRKANGVYLYSDEDEIHQFVSFLGTVSSINVLGRSDANNHNWESICSRILVFTKSITK